jgi:1,4-alpha-glucan branching enzyme
MGSAPAHFLAILFASLLGLGYLPDCVSLRRSRVLPFRKELLMSAVTTAPNLAPVVTAVSQRPGLLRIPFPAEGQVEVRFAELTERDRFDRGRWRREPLKASFDHPGLHEIDLDALRLADGAYEYEFLLEGHDRPVPDPFAEEITRFDGYRGVFRIAAGRRVRASFSWDDELPGGARLPDNNQIVVYEMPLRWMDTGGDDAGFRQVDLGTFEAVLFRRLDDLQRLGVNAVELLPIQDSPDTLNWGYGTRFFFAPDFDMGPPLDLKLLVKQCHHRGMRVFLDVVMNHSAGSCPLVDLAERWFYLPNGSTEEGGRPEWGGRVFRYARPVDGAYHAREFHCRMAEFWVREFHVDGFRIDEFKGINNWDFVQVFRERAWAAHRAAFPDRPFLVIAEDSWRRTVITQNDPGNPDGRQVVDSMWNFAFRDEARRLLRDGIVTRWGEPSRSDRVRALVSASGTWDDLGRQMRRGFSDLSQAINYVTSHDVEKPGEHRFMNEVLGRLLRERGLGDGSVADVRAVVDGDAKDEDGKLEQAHRDAREGVRSAFALLLTSVGVPMFLAGEEFADVHDLDPNDWRLKMSDPVDWSRRGRPGHQVLWDRVAELIALRKAHAALQRDEVEFFYFHPATDADGGERVFAFCRNGGMPLGRRGQVVVVVNAGPQHFGEFLLPWPWTETAAVSEVGPPASTEPPQFLPHQRQASIPLAPFQVRVFGT